MVTLAALPRSLLLARPGRAGPPLSPYLTRQGWPGALCKGRGGAGRAAVAAAAPCPGTATLCGSSRGCGSTRGTGGGRPGEAAWGGRSARAGAFLPVFLLAFTRGGAVFVWGFYGWLPAPATAG